MARDSQSARLAVILHADVADSTRMVQTDEHVAHDRIQDTFRRFAEIISKYSGRVLESRGDAILAEFERPSDAVTATLAFQANHSDYLSTLDDDLKPEVRVGIAMGEVVIADNTITGAGVVLAQRVEQLANPGSLCITAAIHEALSKRYPFELDDLGEQNLKGFDHHVRVYRVSLSSGSTVPSPDQTRPISKPQSSRRVISIVTALVLLIVAGSILWVKPWQPREEPASLENMVLPLPDKPSIAVLPFDNLGDNPDQNYLGEALSENIITELSRFKELFVIARNSSFAMRGRPVRAVAEELGVRYVLEGSIQTVENNVRVTAQLIDATSGWHLWAERYDRELKDILALQDEVTKTVVVTLGQTIDLVERDRATNKPVADLNAVELRMRARDEFLNFTRESTIESQRLGEKAVELDPNYAGGYIHLAFGHVFGYRYGWSDTHSREESLELALEMGNKAVEVDPFNYETHWAFANALSAAGKDEQALKEYDKAMELNPNAAGVLAESVELLHYLGRSEEAISRVEKAIRLNPRHPDWYLWQLGLAQYFTKRYEDALVSLNKMNNLPNGARRTLAPVLVRLGRLEEARTVMAEFLENEPGYSLEDMKVWPFKHKEYLERWTEDQRKAGAPEYPPLELPDKPSIAVLPFTNMSGDPEQEYFVDGMTEDLITDLAKVESLFVIARNTVFTYKGKPIVVPDIASELGVKYVLEGSVRRNLDQVRINAQLIDGASGGHIWAERYDGSLADVFELQDKVTGEIIAALKITLTPDERERRERKGTGNLGAHDAYLKGWQFYRRYTPEDFVEAIPHFERAVELDPDYGQAWAALASVYWISYQRSYTWTLIVNPNKANFVSWQGARDKAERYLGEAMRNPTPLAHQIESQMSLNFRQFDKALSEAERAIALDPNDPEGYLARAWALIHAGRAEEAVALAETGMQLDPYYPASHLYVLGMAQLMNHKFTEAEASLERALGLNPENKNILLPLAVAYVHLDKQDRAQNALKQFIDFFILYAPRIETYIEWWSFKREVDIRFFGGGLIKAGLCCEEQLEAYIDRVRQGGTLE